VREGLYTLLPAASGFCISLQSDVIYACDVAGAFILSLPSIMSSSNESSLKMCPIHLSLRCCIVYCVRRAREGHFQARPHDVPLFAWTGTMVPRQSRHSSHRSCIATSATFRQPTPAHCALLSTQHIRSSGFSGCWSDGLELTAR